MSWPLFNHNIVPYRASYACDKFRTEVPQYVDHFWPAESSVYNVASPTNYYLPASKGTDIPHYNRTNDASQEIIPYSDPVITSACYDSWRATHDGFGASGAYFDFAHTLAGSGKVSFGWLGKQYSSNSNIEHGQVRLMMDVNAGGSGTFAGFRCTPHSRQFTGVDNFRVGDNLNSNRTDKAWSAITGNYTDYHWYHFDCSWSGGSFTNTGYVDGVQQATLTWSNGSVVSAKPRQLQIFGAPLTNIAANGNYNNFYLAENGVTAEQLSSMKTAYQLNQT